MEHKLATYVCNQLLELDVINSEYFDVYVYGIELLLSFLTSTIIILSIGILLGQVVNTIIFLLVFIIVRRFTGGYHANTYLLCKICTVGTYLIVMSMSLFHPIYSTLCYIILVISGLPVIIIWGPVDNPNKPLEANEKKKHKAISILLYISTLIIGLILLKVSLTLSNVVCYTLAAIIILMIISILTKGDTNHEENHC